MTNIYNTGNPLGSTDPRDLLDNASNLDDAMNSTSPTWTDRLGVIRDTYAGQENQFDLAQAGRETQFQDFLVASGFVSLGNYAAGMDFTLYNQYMARDGFFYRPAPSSIPFTTTGTWVGGDEDLFVLLSPDDVLRQELADVSDPAKGLGLVGFEFTGGTASEALEVALVNAQSMANIANHGAALDGVTDDRAALMAAIATGKNVVIPGGAFLANLLAGDVSTVLLYLDKIHIFASSAVIQLPDGVTEFSGRILAKGTNLNRLTLRGTPQTTLTMVSFVGKVSNGAGDHDYTIEYADASTVSIGDFIGIRGMVGTRQGAINGVWKVTAKSGNQVTFKVTAKKAATSAPAATVGGTHVKFNTVLKFTGNHVGLQVACDWGSTSSLDAGIQNMVMEGPGTGAASVGIFVESGCRLNIRTHFGVWGFGSHGIEALYGADIQAASVLVSNCQENGLYALNKSSIQAVTSAISGNAGFGVVASVGSILAISSASVSGNQRGFLVDGSSRMVLSSGLMNDNAAEAGNVTNQSSASIASSTITYGGTAGVTAGSNSYVVATGATLNNNTGLDLEELDVTSTILGGTVSSEKRSNVINRTLQVSQANDFGSIAAGAEATFTIAVPGVTVGKTNVLVNANVNTAGLFFDAFPSATNEITVRASNNTAGAIDPANRTFYLTIFMHP